MYLLVHTILIFFETNNEVPNVVCVNSMTKTGFLNIFHQNVCGISNKKSELEVYIESSGTLLDYLCISEHFLNAESAHVFNMNNYNLVSYNTRTNKKKGR